MPILFVNGKRRGTRVRGRAKIRARRKNGAKRGRPARRSVPVMAKQRRKRRARTTKRTRARRTTKRRTTKRRARRTKRRTTKRRARRTKRRTTKRRARRTKRRTTKRRARKRAAPKRRRRGRKRAAPKRRRRARRSSRPSSQIPGPATPRVRRRRRVSGHVTLGPTAATVRAGGGTQRGYAYKGNPGRRRRRRKHRRSSYHGRYRRRSYRRNPGSEIMDLAKRALPTIGAFYLTRVMVAKVGPMLPGISSLGSLQGPVVAGLTAFGLNFATKKVAALAEHRTEIMLGAIGSVFDAAISAFAPASVKTMVGMADYVQMGDYIGIGATPLNDRMTLSDYVGIGSDGVEEELGIEEELGVEEELGNNDMLGGIAGTGALVKRIASQQFVSPVPARSFSQQIPDATTAYDNPAQLYGGIFGGGFGK